MMICAEKPSWNNSLLYLFFPTVLPLGICMFFELLLLALWDWYAWLKCLLASERNFSLLLERCITCLCCPVMISEVWGPRLPWNICCFELLPWTGCLLRFIAQWCSCWGLRAWILNCLDWKVLVLTVVVDVVFDSGPCSLRHSCRFLCVWPVC